MKTTTKNEIEIKETASIILLGVFGLTGVLLFGSLLILSLGMP